MKAEKNTLGYGRVGIVMRKKLFRSAVERHAVKRRILHGSREALKKSYDILIFPSASLKNVPPGKLKEALHDSFEALSRTP